VAERRGYLTITRQLAVAGGTTSTEKLALVPIESVVTLKYPYPRWAPYAISGGGVAVGLAGLAVWLSGKSDLDRYDGQLRTECPAPIGCANGLPSDLASERSHALLEGKIGVSMMVAGGVIAVGGIVGAIMDRPKRILPNVDVAPLRGGGAEVSLHGSF
jgi:hypothetical protein